MSLKILVTIALATIVLTSATPAPYRGQRLDTADVALSQPRRVRYTPGLALVVVTG